MSYGVIFWGNSHLSNNIFKIQKRIIRIIINKGKHDSCQNLCKQLQILTLPSQYIFSLLIYVANHRDLFLSNSEIHDINVLSFETPRPAQGPTHPPTQWITVGNFTLQMIFLCVKMIHNTVHDMFIIFCTVKILYILYIYGLCHILSPSDTIMDQWKVCMKVYL